MKKYIPILFAATFLFAGCTEDEPFQEPDPIEVPPPDPGTDPGTNPEPEPEPEPNPYKTGVDRSLTSFVDWDYGATDEYYLLGYGYDATGRFAHPGFVRKKVLDIRVLDEERDVVTIIKYPSSQTDYAFWGPEQECREDFCVHANFSDGDIKKYPNLFKEALTPVFNNDNIFPELEYTYYGFSSVRTHLIMKFLWNSYWHSENYLTEEFRQALTDMPADEIIETFGTHMITNLLKGSRLDIYYRSTSSDLSNIRSWAMYYSNYYIEFGDPSHTPDIDQPLKDNIYYEFIYGAKPNPNAFLVDILNYEGERVSFEGMNKLEDEKFTLIWLSHLRPIYELIIDPVKKEEVKNAFDRYLGASE